jgi:hypothetical protein
MFRDCINLTKAVTVLPAKTIAKWCYSGMYRNTSITIGPKLPATITFSYSYANLFHTCKKLVSAPDLPAETIGDRCYSGMFANCTSLLTAPELPATKLAAHCYTQMFYNCSQLTIAPNLPAL